MELTVAEAERRLRWRTGSLARLVLLGAPEIILVNARRMVRDSQVDLAGACLEDGEAMIAKVE